VEVQRQDQQTLMPRHANLPFHLYVTVPNHLLGPGMPAGTTRGIWHAVYSRPGQMLMTHVLLESGAHWCGLPMHGLLATDDGGFWHDRHDLEPWGGMGEHLECLHLHYLEGLEVVTIKYGWKGRHTGIVIDWTDGFSRYPQEHKPLNLLEMDTGQFALLPNNYVTYSDKHLVNPSKREDLKNYRRGETTYWEG
jgi:hypothetical protein